MYRDPGLWNSLMMKLTNATAAYLNHQILAGADAIQDKVVPDEPDPGPEIVIDENGQMNYERQITRTP